MAYASKRFDDVPFGEDILVMKHITKIYGNGFAANKDVNFTVRKGEIHSLVGENGAGKTTLMKVLFGQETAEEGQIFIAGEESRIKNPLDALDYGIGMVHQHFMLVESLTVAENMVLGREPVKGLKFDYQDAVNQAREVSKKYDLEVDPNALVRDLSVGYKQRVEILKMLLHGARILLLDEPTAVLTPQETKELFKQLKQLREQGFSIVFISHKLNEVKEICDRITVLRAGESVGTVNVSDVTELEISKMMVGRDVHIKIDKEPAKPGETVLRVSGVSHKNKFGLYALKDISFGVRSGEILGVAGVEGNGQSELANLLSGLLPVTEGEITVNGMSLKGKTVRQIREAGVSIVHEDRMAYGSSATQSIAENMVSDRFYQKDYVSGAILRLKKITGQTREWIREFQVKCDGYQADVRTLSGGNIQKVVAAREFSSAPRLLVASHPTRGIDVGASELIRKKMVALRDQKKTAILLFSADLAELLSGSDSIIVMYEGEIAAYFPDASRLNEEILGEYMLGLKKQDKEETGGVIHE